MNRQKNRRIPVLNFAYDIQILFKSQTIAELTAEVHIAHKVQLRC